MISGIEGELLTTSVDSVDISINGLIINVVVPGSIVEVIGKIGDKVKLYTTFIHKDDSMVLYGFKDPEFKITKGKNDWKFEFVISQKKVRRIRPKIYSKTAEKLTSCGVSLMDT